MADEVSAAAMVACFNSNPPQVRGRTVYVQFSNHRELKTDQSHSAVVSTRFSRSPLPHPCPEPTHTRTESKQRTTFRRRIRLFLGVFRFNCFAAVAGVRRSPRPSTSPIRSGAVLLLPSRQMDVDAISDFTQFIIWPICERIPDFIFLSSLSPLPRAVELKFGFWSEAAASPQTAVRWVSRVVFLFREKLFCRLIEITRCVDRLIYKSSARRRTDRRFIGRTPAALKIHCISRGNG